MPSWLTTVLVALFGGLLPTQALGQPAATPAPASIVYIDSGLSHSDVMPFVTTERGPPVAYEAAAAHVAADIWSHGNSVPPDEAAAGPPTTYTGQATLTQVAPHTPSTREQAQTANIGLADLERAGVAAKSESYVYRGVSRKSPAHGDALEGNAVPRNVKGSTTAEQPMRGSVKRPWIVGWVCLVDAAIEPPWKSRRVKRPRSDAASF